MNAHDASMLTAVVFLDEQNNIKQLTNFILAATPCHPLLGGLAMAVLKHIAVAALESKLVRGEETTLQRTGLLLLTGVLADCARARGVAWPVPGAKAETQALGTLIGQVSGYTHHPALGCAIDTRVACGMRVVHNQGVTNVLFRCANGAVAATSCIHP